jgi:hypothetical protein
MVVERYEEVISKADEDIVLDGVRRAFNLVKAQACMLATLSIPAIHKFLLPELKKAWHGVLKKREGLVGSHSMSRVNEAARDRHDNPVLRKSDRGRCGPLQDLEPVDLRLACLQDGVWNCIFIRPEKPCSISRKQSRAE